MRQAVDLTGKRFGRLTVIERDYSKRTTAWLCKCDCGNMHIATAKHLNNGHVKSCGCLNREPKRVAHNMSHSRIYNIYQTMKKRCYNSKDEHYHNYGGRGIKVCDDWLNDFQAFYDWAMANGYKDDLSIDRINVNGNYEPANCCWATNSQQQRNKRNSVKVKYNGETKTIYEWSEIVGIDPLTIADRIRKGWTAEKALTQKVR